VHNFTHNRQQAYVRLRSCTANIVYLQHGGVSYRNRMTSLSPRAYAVHMPDIIHEVK